MNTPPSTNYLRIRNVFVCVCVLCNMNYGIINVQVQNERKQHSLVVGGIQVIFERIKFQR